MSSSRASLPPREVTLVLCRRDGSVIGALAPFDVELPWWQEVGPVVDGALDHHGVSVTVLRLLEATPSALGAGGPVTYLAEVDDEQLLPTTTTWPGDPNADEPLRATSTAARVGDPNADEPPPAPSTNTWAGDPNSDEQPLPTTTTWPGDPNADEPLRATWARPGGPAADLAWADAVLVARGQPRTGPARQVRTWNLSSLWRLPCGGGAAWLKVVPPFFAHEGAVLARLDAAVVPPLLATDGARVLLEEVPGEDQYEATGPTLLPMVDLLVGVQAQWIGRQDELLDLGAPDWRAAPLTALLTDLVDRSASQLEPAVRAELDALVAGLRERFAEIAACGLPDTLVHGDFHRGNVRGSGSAMVLLDWGDSGVGHPMLDQAAFLRPLTDEDQARVRSAWAAAWQAVVPGCDPVRAAELLAPVAALRQALIYQVFLDRIEPAERIYHATDPATWLTRAAELAAHR